MGKTFYTISSAQDNVGIQAKTGEARAKSRVLRGVGDRLVASPK